MEKDLALLPIQYPTLYKIYSKQRSVFWTEHELEPMFFQDKEDWKKIPETTRRGLLKILSFFAVSDGRVNINIEEKIIPLLPSEGRMELQVYYRFQEMMEDIHNLTYNSIMINLVGTSERNQLVASALASDYLGKKMAWISRIMAQENTVEGVVFANAIVEGLGFTPSFAVIIHVNRQYPGLLKAVKMSNEFIQRDEAMHLENAVEMYKLLPNHLPATRAAEMVSEFIEIEKQFFTGSVKEIEGMSVKDMELYLKYVANVFMTRFGYGVLYDVRKNPLPYMELQFNSNSRTDFFTQAPTEYKKGNKVSTVITDDISDF